jgi:hypothetical protein
VVPRKLPHLRLTLVALAAADVLVVAWIAARYGNDGALSVVLALALAPVAVTLTWLLAAKLAGPRFADAAAGIYVILPALGAHFALAPYRSTFTRQAIPDLVGLRATGWFAAGLAIAVVALRRESAPLLAVAGAVLLARGWSDLGGIRSVGLHETTWSITLIEYLPLAGLIGAGRRSWLRAAGLGGWLAAAVGHAATQGYDHAAFWQSLAIATPAIAVIVTSLWLLVPPLRSAAPASTRAR